MRQNRQIGHANHPVKFFLTSEENERYEAFLAPFAGKKGPYAKKVLFDYMKGRIQELSSFPPSLNNNASRGREND